MCRLLSLVAFCLVTVLLVSGGNCAFNEEDDRENFVFPEDSNGNFVPAQFLAGPVSNPSSVQAPVPVWVFPWGTDH